MKRLLTILICLLAASCVRERGGMDSERMNVHFRINTPGRVAVGTRAEAEENVVNKVALMVLGEEEGEYVFQYTAVGRNLDPDDALPEVDFEAILRVSEDPVRLLVVTNYPDGTLDNVSPGDTEEEVREALTGSVVTTAGAYPMSGVKDVAAIEPGMGSIRVAMLRPMAKVVVESTAADFVVTSMAVYRANDSWRYFPDAESIENEQTAPKALIPSLPTGVAAVPDKPLTVVSGGQTVAYLFESEANTMVDRATCIVVGGRYNGSTTETFYRLDIGGTDDLGDVHPLGQLLRNYIYQFTVTNVTSDGWPTPDDAANNPATGLVAEVLPWNGGNDSEYHFGKDRYIILSKSGLLVDPEAGATDSLYITTSEVDFTIFSDRNPIAGPLDTQNPSQTLETDLMIYTLTAVAAPDHGQQRWMLKATAKTADIIGVYLHLQSVGNEEDILIPVNRNAELAINRISELEAVPVTGTNGVDYVEYQIDIPDGMTWSASVTGQSWASGNTALPVHEGYLLNAAGLPVSSLTGQSKTVTLRVGFDQLYYPTVGETPRVDIRVSLDGVPTMVYTITVKQDPLLGPTGSLGFLDVYASGYGALTGSYIRRYSQYLEEPRLYGPTGAVKTSAPITISEIDSKASADPTQIAPGFRYLHIGGYQQTSYTQARYDAVNAYWHEYGNQRLFAWVSNQRTDAVFANAPANSDRRTTILTLLGVDYRKPEGTGYGIKINTSPQVLSSSLFRYLTQDGPFGTVTDYASHEYYNDNLSMGADPASLPATAIPLMMDQGGGTVMMFVDPANGVVFIGDSQIFDTGSPSFSSVSEAVEGDTDGHSRLLLNFLAYVVNCSQYGSGFANLFIPGNEALYDEAFHTTP